ncbi:MAG TPA: LptA/OstA family protein [Opitutaceae bacterium]|jgi:lipopolysaccharide export system protein LptA
MRPLSLVAAAALVLAPLSIRAASPAPPPETTTVSCAGLAESVSTDNETTTVFHDDVVATGNNITLYCDYLKVITTGINNKGETIAKHDKFKYMLATGHVRILQGDRLATCGRAEVFPGEDRIVLTETPVVEIASEHYKMSGPRMILYRGQRRAVIEGTPSDRTHVMLPAIKDLGFPSEPTPTPTPTGQPAK